jgi:hypothetical protein
MVPKELITSFQEAYQSVTRRNMLMTVALLRIMTLLERHGLSAIAFKGPSLAHMAYGDITLRQFGDLDILVRKEDRTLVLELLLREGYVPEIRLKESSKKQFFNHLNAIGLHKPSSGIHIEIHWELLSKNYAVNWKEQYLWKDDAYLSINHQKIRVLPTEQLLLYLCVHGSKHLFERLEWICDIDRSVRSAQEIDWTNLYSEAKSLGVTRMLHLGLLLAQHLLGLELPSIVEQQIKRDLKVSQLVSTIIALHFSSNPRQGKRYSTFILLWKMRENYIDRLRFAWHALFAPQFNDFKYIQLPEYLSFGYLLIRPFRLLMKYLHKP